MRADEGVLMDINAAMTTTTAQMIDAMGMTVTYTPLYETAREITVLFDDEYQELDLLSGMASSSAPAVHCKTADVSVAAKGDAVVVNSVNYIVTAIKPDGTGMTTLVLKKA